MRISSLLLATLSLVMGPATAFATDVESITVETSRGVSQPFQLITPNNPKAGAILFIGGDGTLGSNKNNFLVTTLESFAEKGLTVALVTQPSDKETLNAQFRLGNAHAGDIIAVISYLKGKADVPIWLVGTSMGTFSATSVAIKKQREISGLVLTSTMTHLTSKFGAIVDRFPDGVASMTLGKIRVPVLIMSHNGDSCEYTPPADAAKLKRKLSKSARVEIVKLKGGLPAESDPCHARSEHGFYGIEDEAVKRIVSFITQ